MSHPIPGHEYGEATLPEADVCKHEDNECVDEVEFGWGLFACNTCGVEWQASTMDARRDAADLARPANI